MTFSGFSKHLGNDAAKSGLPAPTGRPWGMAAGVSRLHLKCVAKQEGRTSPRKASLWTEPFFCTSWKRKRAEGTWLSSCEVVSLPDRAGPARLPRVQVSGIRGERQGGKEKSRENLSVVLKKTKNKKEKKKREKSSCFSFPREKNYLTWHKIYLRGIFLEWLRKNTRCFLAAGKCILNRIHMGPSMITMFGEEPDSK